MIVLWKNNRIDGRYDISEDSLIAQFRAFLDSDPINREYAEYMGTEITLRNWIGVSHGLSSVLSVPESCSQVEWDALLARAKAIIFPEYQS